MKNSAFFNFLHLDLLPKPIVGVSGYACHTGNRLCNRCVTACVTAHADTWPKLDFVTELSGHENATNRDTD